MSEHEFIEVRDRRWCVRCDLFQQRWSDSFPAPPAECPNIYKPARRGGVTFRHRLIKSEMSRHAVADHLEVCGLQIYFPPLQFKGSDHGDLFIIRESESGRIEVKQPVPKRADWDPDLHGELDWNDHKSWQRFFPFGVFLERKAMMSVHVDRIEAFYIVNQAFTHAMIATLRFVRPFLKVRPKQSYIDQFTGNRVTHDMVVCPLDKVQLYELRRAPVRPVAGRQDQPTLQTPVQLDLLS